MKINKNTYEIVFIDYLEGRLSDSELKEMVAFLDQNPELEAELKDLIEFGKQTKQEYKTSSIDINTFKHEAVLDENDSNFDELCIAFYEGLLSEKEEEYLLELTDNDPELLASFETYGKIHFEADEKIVFPDKSKLKRRKTLHLLNYLSYAASIVIVLGFFFFLKDDSSAITEDVQPTQFTQNTYMDYPKVGFEVKKPILINAKKIMPATQEVNGKKMLYVSPSSNDNDNMMAIEEYDYKTRISEQAENQLFSRKGKLAYNTPTELEMYLLDNFSKKNINKISVSDAIQKSQKEQSGKAYGPLSKYSNMIQLATNFKREVAPKKILGSQPAPH